MEYPVSEEPQEQRHRKFLGNKYNSLILFGLGAIFAIVFIINISLMWQSQPTVGMNAEQLARAKEGSGIYAGIAFGFAAVSICALGGASYLKMASKNAELSPNRRVTRKAGVTKTRDFTTRIRKRQNNKIVETTERL